MTAERAPLPGRVWTGFALMVAAGLAHSATFFVAGGTVSRLSATIAGAPPQTFDPSSMLYSMAMFWMIAAVLGILGLVLMVAGFIDYARRPRFWDASGNGHEAGR